jgi:hypothetical protein
MDNNTTSHHQQHDNHAKIKMFEDLDMSFGCDEDEYCGHSISDSVLKIVEIEFPDELLHLEGMIEHFMADMVIPGNLRLPAAFGKDLLARQICTILWDMRPKPQTFTVFTDDGCRYLAFGKDVCCQALNLLYDSFISDNKLNHFLVKKVTKTVPESVYHYAKKERLIVSPKAGKLVKEYFTFKTINSNILGGPESLSRFRRNLPSLSSVVCVDVEAHEWSNRDLLEFGVSEYFPHEDRIISQHFIVEENSWRRNGVLVSDHRDSFIFGESQTLPLHRILVYLRSLFHEGAKICFVAHNAASDIKFLGIADPFFQNIPDMFDVYDTQFIHQELRGRAQPTNLEAILKDLFGKTPACLHNAGNDAHYTLCAMLFMAGINVNV